MQYGCAAHDFPLLTRSAEITYCSYHTQACLVVHVHRRSQFCILPTAYEFSLDYVIIWQAHILVTLPAISPRATAGKKRQSAQGSPSLFAFSLQVVNK